ncbi:MAG: hypothetical protein FXF54_07460 [Kosmotoga sp.]|nr:MAG: hypothetical protein FXF54_07460 [Kosmotoga sp.]
MENEKQTSQETKVSYSTLKGLSYWAGFLGIWILVGAILGFVGAILGVASGGMAGLGAAIPSVIASIIVFIMGYKLRTAKKEIEEYMISQSSYKLEGGLDNLRAFFKIQGILIIIALIIAVIAIVAVLANPGYFNNMPRY